MSLGNLEPVELAKATRAEIFEYLTLNGVEGVREEDKVAVLREKAEAAGFRVILRAPSIMEVAKEMVREIQDRPFDPTDLKKERWCSFTVQGDAENEGMAQIEPIFVSVNDISCYVPRNVRVCTRELVFETIKNCKERRYPSTDETGPLRKFSRERGFWQERYKYTFHGYKPTLVVDGAPPLAKGELLIAPSKNADAVAVSKSMMANRVLEEASRDYTAVHQA